MKKFSINTLTHSYPQAAQYLELVVDSFIKYTNIPEFIKNDDGKLDWFLRLNGTNTELDNTVTSLTNTYSDIIDWHVYVGDNIGVGAGINFLNTVSSEYEYVLFIEGDWIITDDVNENWLSASLQVLQENLEYEQVFLRRYYSDYEDRVNGMREWVNSKSFLGKVEKEGVEFLCLVEGLYTNNPSIRRQQDFFNRGFFPLNEYYDQRGVPTEVKGKSDWGRAEINARTSFLKTLYMWPGIFNHEAGIGFGLTPIPCDNCKYHFSTTGDWFCLSCSKDDSFLEMSRHSDRAIETILPLIEYRHQNKYNDEFIINSVKSVISNPTKPPEELVKYYYD